MPSQFDVCPICNRRGRQKIIKGVLCYVHHKKGEKCCKWGKVVGLEHLLGKKNRKILTFIKVDMKLFSQRKKN